MGDYFTYCITSPTEKRLGELKYKADVCQIKFKVRAVASFNKLPGFPKISGYQQMNKLGPGMLATHSQVAAILNRTSESFPYMQETRELYLSSNPPATMGLSKEALFVKMIPEATRQERLVVTNTILAVNDEA